MDKLPKGWESIDLKLVVLSRKGKKPEHLYKTHKDGYAPYILIDEMEGKPVRAYTNDKSVPTSTEKDVLIVWDGSIGKTASGIKGAIGSTIAALTPLYIETFYLESFLKLSKPYIEQTSRGSGLQHINPDYFWTLQLPIAPLNEQRRIAAKLEKILHRIDTCKERLDKIPLILKRFRQSVLSAACSGRLTADWRENNPNIEAVERLGDGEPPVDFDLPAMWNWMLSEHAFNYVTSGSRGWAQYYSDKGALFIRVGNLNHDAIDLDLRSIQRVSPPDSTEGRRTKVVEGDILISITADVGMVALINADLEEAYINQHVALARPAGNIDRRYLAYFLTAKNGGQRQFLDLQRGATKVGLGLDDIRSIWITRPSLPEQQEIVRRVEALFRKADAIEARYKKAKAFVDKLTQSILAKAFRGELVAQDPNDKPASVLLERIRAEKEKSQKKIVSIKSRVKKYKPFIPSDLPIAAEEKAVYGKTQKKPRGKRSAR